MECCLAARRPIYYRWFMQIIAQNAIVLATFTYSREKNIDL